MNSKNNFLTKSLTVFILMLVLIFLPELALDRSYLSYLSTKIFFTKIAFATLLFLSTCSSQIFFKSLRIFLSLAISFLAILRVFYSLQFRSEPNEFVYLSLLDSNIIEAIEFIENQNISFNSILTILFTLSIISISIYRLNSIDKVRFHFKKSDLIPLSATALVIVTVVNINKVPPQHLDAFEGTLIKDLAMIEDNIGQIRRLRSLNTIPKAKLNFEDSSIKYNFLDKPIDIIVLIGESATKRHFQIYGYPRPTTPNLEKLKNNGDLIIFDDALAAAAHTLPSVMSALGADIKKGYADAIQQQNLIDFFNMANFESYWLSNQKYVGLWETPLSVMTKSAKLAKFFNTSALQSNYFDEVLLNPFEDILKNENKHKPRIFFLHTMGSHGDYKNRYPDSMDFFKDDNSVLSEIKNIQPWQITTINQYDNSIRYTDEVIAKLITAIKRQNKATLFIYFSDHGDEVYSHRDFAGHSDTNPSLPMYQVPFFTWASPQFREAYPEIIEKLRSAQKRKLVISNLTATLLDLFGFSTEYFDEERSIFRTEYKFADFVPTPLTPPSSEPNQAHIDFKDRLWVHAVDTVERLRFIESNYTGIEVDIFFDEKKNVLDIRHPPLPSIDFTLEALLKSSTDHQRLNIWLDLKNLNYMTVDSILEEIDRLDRKYSLKKRLVIESSEYMYLRRFRDSGYLTSYYVPYFNLNDPAEIERNIATIQKILQMNIVDAISFDYDRYYPIINKHFPKVTKLTWTMVGNIDDHRDKMKSILNDPSIKVLLASPRATTGRRADSL